MQRFAIISDSPGWHGRQLQRALDKRGYGAHFVPLQACSFDLERRNGAVVLPGFETDSPAGVFVRGIPGGSFEEVTFWLDILHALRETGVPVYNDARGIERTVDKAMTSFLLQREGIATPPCWVFSNPDAARALVDRELASGHQLVYKPLFGSQGKGLGRITDPGQLGEPGETAGVYYLQRFIETAGDYFMDWRVFVIGGRAVAAMQRKSPDWITNVANGGECFSALANEAVADLAQQAVERLGLAYAGVDIICGTDGNYQVIEVNSIPAWRGLQGVCSTSVADLLIEHFLGFCRDSACMGVVG
jgi:RimK family alpha-L-glutamate ligase